MSTTQAALHLEDTAKPGDLYVSFELSDKSWKLTFGDVGGAVSRHTVTAGDQAIKPPWPIASFAPAGASRRPRAHECTAATRPVAMAGGCTVG